jgi:dystonin
MVSLIRLIIVLLQELQRRSEEYRTVASSLLVWMREKLVLMQERSFPLTLIEMKKLASESARFRNEEVPVKQHDKNRLGHLWRELEKHPDEMDVEVELRPDTLEKMWQRLMQSHQERDQAIVEEIKRLERLQRLAEKVHREMKGVEGRLEELEHRLDEEARRLDRLHPLDAKHIVDALEQDIRLVEESIQALFSDVQVCSSIF